MKLRNLKMSESMIAQYKASLKNDATILEPTEANALEVEEQRKKDLEDAFKETDKTTEEVVKATTNKESIKVKDRKELSRLIKEAADTNKKWNVSRCSEDGYRYIFESYEEEKEEECKDGECEDDLQPAIDARKDPVYVEKEDDKVLNEESNFDKIMKVLDMEKDDIKNESLEEDDYFEFMSELYDNIREVILRYIDKGVTSKDLDKAMNMISYHVEDDDLIPDSFFKEEGEAEETSEEENPAEEPKDESLNEGIDTSKLGIDKVIGWISEHDDLYSDFKEFFNYDYDEASGKETNKPSKEKVIDWLSEHDQAFDDFKSFFEIKDESLEEGKKPVCVHVYDIVYDTDGEDIQLPTDMDLEIEEEGGDLEEIIAEKISDETGWLVDHFSYDMKEKCNENCNKEPLKEYIDAPTHIVKQVAISGTPEEADKEFKDLGYKVEVKVSNPDHFYSYYLIDIIGSKEELESLADDPVEAGLFTKEEIEAIEPDEKVDFNEIQ